MLHWLGHVLSPLIMVTLHLSIMFQEEESGLQKLNLSDCKLKTDINNMINALGSNQCLQVSFGKSFNCLS